MFLTRLKVVVGVVVVLAGLGFGGVTYHTAQAQTAAPPKRAEGKPPSEVEALRKEVELLRLNLLVVLEKVRAQEAELNGLRGKPAGPTPVRRARDGNFFTPLKSFTPLKNNENSNLRPTPPATPLPEDAGTYYVPVNPPPTAAAPPPANRLSAPPPAKRPGAALAQDAEAILKVLRMTKDATTRRNLEEQLARSLQRLAEQLRQPAPERPRLPAPAYPAPLYGPTPPPVSP